MFKVLWEALKFAVEIRNLHRKNYKNINNAELLLHRRLNYFWKKINFTLKTKEAES